MEQVLQIFETFNMILTLGTYIQDRISWIENSYALDLSFPNRKRLEVSKNVKYIAITLRVSKLPMFKVWLLQDLNPGLPREPISLW